MIKNLNRKLIRVTSSNEGWKQKCINLRAYKNISTKLKHHTNDTLDVPSSKITLKI